MHNKFKIFCKNPPVWFLGWFVGQNSNKISSFFFNSNQNYTAEVYIAQGSPQGVGHLFLCFYVVTISPPDSMDRIIGSVDDVEIHISGRCSQARSPLEGVPSWGNRRPNWIIPHAP